MTHPCVSWLSHISTDATFLSKATDYFSHMHHRLETKNHWRESLPQPGHESDSLAIELPPTGRVEKEMRYGKTDTMMTKGRQTDRQSTTGIYDTMFNALFIVLGGCGS